jgi:hypothetical protein
MCSGISGSGDHATQPTPQCPMTATPPTVKMMIFDPIGGWASLGSLN